MEILNNRHLPNRILYAVIFAALFSIVGWAIPEVWYKYIDETEYLVISQPISVDKKLYEPCEETTLTTKLTAKVDLNVSSLTQLVLTNENGDSVRVGRVISAEAPIKAREEHIISGSLPLPCDLKEGAYFWQGNATYSVRGFDRTLSFITETFTVEKEATESAELEPTPSPTPKPTFLNTGSVRPMTQPAPQPTQAPQPTGQPSNSTTIINNNPPAQSQPTPAPQPQPTPNPNNGNPPVQICLPVVGCITPGN